MCGFAGYFSASVPFHATELLKQMGDTIAHRGPDDSGTWHDNEAGLGFTHRRLSIIDLSAAGHQPMLSASGRYVIVFNGEIYNHLTLRNELETNRSIQNWRGHSDTETLLAGFDRWGIESTINKSIGMFAFAVWDRKTRQLTLGRDRLGEKPLYYGWQGHGEQAVFLFGSELKAIRIHPAFQNDINRGAVSLLLNYNYIPAPYSIYKGISKLRPGCLLTLSLEQRETIECPYWSTLYVAESGSANPFKGTSDQAVDELETLLKDATRQQMMADVPLGAFLSGGVDSSLIVALMQAQSSRPVKTFTIGFFEHSHNEAVQAKAIAEHLGTDHTELYVTAKQAMDVIPQLPFLFDEPFSDSSQIPTFLVSNLAKQHVTVSLSGDAGDELFCGYNRYVMTSCLWHKIDLLPLSLRRLIEKGLIKVPPNKWDNIARLFTLFNSTHPFNIGEKLHKGAGVLTSESVDELYTRFISHWIDSDSVVIDNAAPSSQINDLPVLNGLNYIQRMMAKDCISYLPDDILVKVDRTAMGVSLESRIPFLDHRVVEYAWKLPQSMKLRNGQSKWALRQVLYRYVPKNLIERPKMGFSMPIGDWLRHDLRDWAEAMLNESRLRREGYFQPAPIRQKWKEHLSGKSNWQYHLWDVLMFQAWLEQEKAH
jgi:asparagine synthase (glutamine-hydrolysing)